ncbi:MAG: hypothetical protein EA399_01040, partial [Desulfovibrionales bacterium]
SGALGLTEFEAENSYAMRSLQKVSFPAKTCDVILLNTLERLDSGFLRNDEFQCFATFCSNI